MLKICSNNEEQLENATSVSDFLQPRHPRHFGRRLHCSAVLDDNVQFEDRYDWSCVEDAGLATWRYSPENMQKHG